MTTAIAPTQGALNLAGIGPTSAITIHTSAGDVIASPQDILTWVAPDAPIQEAVKFLVACKAMRLNPLLKEAYLVNYGGKWSPIVAKAGYLKCAKEQPGFAGHENGIIAQTFDQKSGARGEPVELKGTFLPAGSIVIGGWAKVHIKGIKLPVHATVSMTEYAKKTPTWASMPCTMIAKVALVMAIREAFPNLSGYDESETGPEQAPAPVVATAPPPAPAGEQEKPAEEPAPATIQVEAVARPTVVLGTPPVESFPPPQGRPDIWESIDQMMAELGVTEDQRAKVLAKRGVSKVRDMTLDQAEELASKLRERLPARVDITVPDATRHVSAKG